MLQNIQLYGIQRMHENTDTNISKSTRIQEDFFPAEGNFLCLSTKAFLYRFAEIVYTPYSVTDRCHV